MPHWEYYVLLAAGGPLGIAAMWRYAPQAILMLVGGLTKNPQRSAQCLEMVRLSHKDAKDLGSYMMPADGGGEPSQRKTGLRVWQAPAVAVGVQRSRRALRPDASNRSRRRRGRAAVRRT